MSICNARQLPANLPMFVQTVSCSSRQQLVGGVRYYATLYLIDNFLYSFFFFLGNMKLVYKFIHVSFLYGDLYSTHVFVDAASRSPWQPCYPQSKQLARSMQLPTSPQPLIYGLFVLFSIQFNRASQNSLRNRSLTNDSRSRRYSNWFIVFGRSLAPITHTLPYCFVLHRATPPPPWIHQKTKYDYSQRDAIEVENAHAYVL